MQPPDEGSPHLVALRNAVASRDVAAIVRILGDDPSIELLGDPALIREAMMSIPGSAVERHPVLSMMAPIFNIMYFEPVQNGAPEPARTIRGGVTPAQHELIVFLRMLARRRRSEFDEAGALAERLRELIRVASRSAGGARNDRIPFYYLHMGMTSLLRGDTVQALADLALAEARATSYRLFPPLRRTIAALTALVHALRGSTVDARSFLALGASVSDDDHMSGYFRHIEHAVRTVLDADALQWDADAPLSPTGAELSEELWPVFLLAATRRAFAVHAPELVLDMVAVATNDHPTPPRTLAADVATSASVRALTELGELSAARAAFERSTEPGPWTRLASARLNLHLGDHERARDIARRLILDPGSAASVREEAGLLLSWIEAAQSGRPDDGLAATLRQLAAERPRLLTGIPASLVHAAADTPDAAIEGGPETLAGVAFAAELPVRPRLTDRESVVLSTIIRLGTVAAAAEALTVSPNTVKTQLTAAYRKLGVRNRSEALKVVAGLDLELDEGA